MTILHRYLLRQFFKSYLMIFTCLVGIFIIADFVGHLSEFMDRTSDDHSLLNHLLVFYGARVPWFFEVAGRLIVLLAAVFVIAAMQRHSEMTALEAAGVSRWQIVRPLVWGAAIVALGAAANRELGIPRVREQLCQQSSEGSLSKARKMVPRYDPQTNILYDGRELYPPRQQIADLSLRLPTAWPPVGRTLHAKSATFLTATGDHPSGYLLQGLTPAADWKTAAPYRVIDDTIIYTAREAPWLPADSCFLVSQLSVEAFHNSRRWRLYNSTWDLWNGLQSGETESGADVHLAIHARMLQPFVDVSLFFVGIPFVLRTQKRHFFGSAAKTILIGSAVTILVVACHALGLQGLFSPALAAWLPLLVLGPLAVLVSAPLAQ